MAQTFSKISETCATCTYWGGHRQVVSSGQMVSVGISLHKKHLSKTRRLLERNE